MTDSLSREDDSSASASGTPPDRKCCMGVLYFSQKLHENGRNPVCAGIRTRVTMPHVDDLAHNDVVPAGGFKYFCVGMSLWDQERLSSANKKAVKPGDPVELPYCEGLEIISAAQLQQAPVILSTEAGVLPQAAEPSTSEPQRPPNRERPPQYFPGGDKGFGEAVDWSAFPGKFQQTAGKVLAKMHSNALLIANNLRQTVEELSGRGRGQ